MLIIEIVLTVFAWRKGWKWLALLPMGLALIIGALIGFAIGTSGGNVTGATGFGIALDVFAIIALIIMMAKPPKLETNVEELKDSTQLK